MRIDLKVPYHEKDEAKALGAWWDAERKTWFVRSVENLEPFMRWIDPRLLQLGKQPKGQSGNYLAVSLLALRRPPRPMSNYEPRQKRPSLQAHLASGHRA